MPAECCREGTGRETRQESATLEMFCSEPVELKKVYSFKDETIDDLPKNRERAQEISEQIQNRGISVLTELDAAYPAHLKSVLNGQCHDTGRVWDEGRYICSR